MIEQPKEFQPCLSEWSSHNNDRFMKGLFGPSPRENCEQKADVSQRNAGKFKSGLIFLGGFRGRISDPMFFPGIPDLCNKCKAPRKSDQELDHEFHPNSDQNCNQAFPN